MERLNWINEMYEKYLNDTSMESVSDRMNGRTEVYKVISKHVKKVATSHCDSSSKFDRKTGIAIAYARLIGEDIPDYVLHNKIIIKDITIGGMFVLKFNHKTYVKVCEHPNYPKKYLCTSIEKGEKVLMSGDEEVEKIF